jgi:hypothetical protein
MISSLVGLNGDPSEGLLELGPDWKVSPKGSFRTAFSEYLDGHLFPS